jgi:hypothetical protein
VRCQRFASLKKRCSQCGRYIQSPSVFQRKTRLRRIIARMITSG